MATRIFWEFRTERKLTELPLTKGTATINANTRLARNTQAQTCIRLSSTFCEVLWPGGAWGPLASADLVAVSVIIQSVPQI